MLCYIYGVIYLYYVVLYIWCDICCAVFRLYICCAVFRLYICCAVLCCAVVYSVHILVKLILFCNQSDFLLGFIKTLLFTKGIGENFLKAQIQTVSDYRRKKRKGLLETISEIHTEYTQKKKDLGYILSII